MAAVDDIAREKRKRSGKTPPVEPKKEREVDEDFEAEIRQPLNDVKEYEDQEREFEGMEETGEQGNEARGMLQDFNKGDAELGLATLTALETRDQAAAMTELRIYHTHYPEFGIDKIPIWMDAYSVSIGRGGRKENTDVLRGNVPITPPAQNQGPPRW